MPLHLADEGCLHPRMLDTLAREPRRVVGLLRRAGEPSSPHLIDAVVDEDGRISLTILEPNRRSGRRIDA